LATEVVHKCIYRYSPLPFHREGVFIERPEYKLEEAKKIAFNLRNSIYKNEDFKCVIAGSILRKKSIVHDIDILVSRTDENYRAFCSAIIHAIPSSGYIPLNKASGSYEEIPTQIWFCNEDEWAPNLLEKTGPMNFNQFIRNRAKAQGQYLSNKGLFLRNPDDTPGKRIDNNTEGNIIWLVLGKRWIPPEMRY